MRTLSAIVLATALAMGTVAATDVPASAHGWHHGGCWGCGLGWGIGAGLALGAILSYPYYAYPYPYSYAPYPYPYHRYRHCWWQNYHRYCS